MWHFSQANSDHIKKAVDLFDWESALIDLDVNEQVSVFNDTITNIMPHFVPNEIIICDDRDPPWMNRHIKNLILYKAIFYKTFVRGKNSMFHLLTFNNLRNHLNQFIQKAKQNYLNKVTMKLSDPSTSTKCYWSLLKNLLNNKKMPFIFPIFHNNKYVVDFKENSEIFNTFFAEQCSIIANKSVLPSRLTLLTENSLANCHFSKKDNLQIIRNLESNKAHGHDMISIRMLKLCGDSICKPLELIFKTCLRNGRFPLE